MSTDVPTLNPPRSTRPFLWAGLGVSLCLVLLAMGLVLPRQKELPRLGKLPAFTFTRQDGQPFGRAELLGRPFVANFIFTRCPTICPVFTQKMARFQKQTAGLGGELALVSFSVDPEYDTPERLTAYAARYGADPSRWSFLTGDYTRLQDTIVGGFKIAMGRESDDENDIPGIFHGSHFVLVDATGEIRGYYDSADDDTVERLTRDAERLVHGAQ